MCADKTLAEDSGVSCDSPGLKITSTGAHAYVCCRGYLCNTKAASEGMLEDLAKALPSEAYCAEQGLSCVETFSQSYQCLLTSVPNIQVSDQCFGSFIPEVGCLADYCRKADHGLKGDHLHYASPGCPVEKIGNNICDALCMSPESAMDGGDCLVVSTIMDRKFRAADWNSDGLVDQEEFDEMQLYVGNLLLSHFDISRSTIDGKDGLDRYEFGLLLTRYDHLVQDQLFGISGENMKWERFVALGAATQIVLTGDHSMDGLLSQQEAQTAFGCTIEDFDLIIRLGGRYPSEEELSLMSPESRIEMQNKMSGEKMMQVGDLARVMYGMVAALAGDNWADSEFLKGFSVEEAVRLTIKFSDYNKDGYMSRAESALLSMPAELFDALSPRGKAGDMLSLDNLLNALEDVSGCEQVLVVDKPGDLSLKTLYMPRGRCSVLIMPGWNVPASYPPVEAPRCSFDLGSGSGSGSGSGAGYEGDACYSHDECWEGLFCSVECFTGIGCNRGERSDGVCQPCSECQIPEFSVTGSCSVCQTGRRRLLEKKAGRAAAGGQRSRGSATKGEKGAGRRKGKSGEAAGRGMHRVLAKHHQHHLLSSTLPANVHAKAGKMKKRKLVNVEKHEMSSKQARARRRSHVEQELRKLKSARPAARVRAMVRSRRKNVEQALARSMEQSAMRVVKRGSRALLDKHGMRAYRRATGSITEVVRLAGRRLQGMMKQVRAKGERTRSLRRRHGSSLRPRMASRNDVGQDQATTRTYHEDEAVNPCLDPATYMPDMPEHFICESRSDDPAVEANCPRDGCYSWTDMIVENGAEITQYICECPDVSGEECAEKYPGEPQTSTLIAMQCTEPSVGLSPFSIGLSCLLSKPPGSVLYVACNLTQTSGLSCRCHGQPSAIHLLFGYV